MIFPEHAALLERVRSRLETATAPGAATLIGIAEATRLVLEHYLHEGDLARARYRLTRTVTTLRDRELASTLQYHRVYRDALRAWTGEEAGRDLRAELLAAAVVTAHNHVLRRWLRGVVDGAGAVEELGLALEEALGTGPSGTRSAGAADERHLDRGAAHAATTSTRCCRPCAGRSPTTRHAEAGPIPARRAASGGTIGAP